MHKEFAEELWFKSSYTTEQGQCVEVAMDGTAVGVRDSENRRGGHFTGPGDRWSGSSDRVRAGKGDMPSCACRTLRAPGVPVERRGFLVSSADAQAMMPHSPRADWKAQPGFRAGRASSMKKPPALWLAPGA